MADNSKISMVDGLTEIITHTLPRNLGQAGLVPTRAEMAETQGEGTGPLYNYHAALNQLGQHTAELASEFSTTVHGIQVWMVEAIADLERTDLEAAETLRKLQADIEGYEQGLRSSSASSPPSAAKVSTPSSQATSDWA